MKMKKMFARLLLPPFLTISGLTTNLLLPQRRISLRKTKLVTMLLMYRALFVRIFLFLATDI